MIGQAYLELESARDEGSLRMELRSFEIRDPLQNIKTADIPEEK